MKIRNQVSLTRKALYGIMLFGIFFSAFGMGNFTSARAQEGEPVTPTPEIQAQETVTPEAVLPGQEAVLPPQNYLPGRNQQGGKNQIPLQAGSDAFTLGAPGLSFRYTQTFGTAEMPYFSDTTHLNRPEGLFMGAGDNLYVAENQGARILRYNSGGANTLAIGKAGVQYTDDYVFQNPSDMALDSGGNIWVADYSRVVQYDSSGIILQSFPAQNDNPWQTGNTNGRFDNVRGIAFGSDGRMYVSDSNNHRVQVYTFTAGSPVYSATIGTTSVSGSDNTHFNSPYRIAMYGSSDLYVVDTGNNRVQHCVDSGTWSCTIFDSGLNNPQGITVNGSNVYVADTNNGRIRKCTTTNGSCSDFATNTWWLSDLAVDSSGSIYGSTSWSATVVKYNNVGNEIGVYLGVHGVPYLTDNYHYNQPRVAIDGSDNIIIVEEAGQRLTKLNAGGVLQWSKGIAGVDDNDNTHLNWPRGVAVDTSGNIYVADSFRVQIFNGSGAYLATIGTGRGNGNYEFGWANGIAVDNIGTIYVSDCNNNRVQVYNSSRTYVTTLGVTGISGSDNGHLNCPMGVGVDTSRNIYVADGGNNRVQKFNSSLIYQMTLGASGGGSEDFAHFGGETEDIAVDALGRIYVADIWNNRVQVFDSSGAYLASISDNWGANPGQFRGASSVDLDSQGNVYISDQNNARIQKFTPGVPGWQQKNINGFGDRNNSSIHRMSVFNGYLYAGTYNTVTGGEVWRSADGVNWNQVNTDGFGDAHNVDVEVAETFNGNLYMGTENSDTGGQIWRCAVCDGSDWTRVVNSGLGDSNNNKFERVVVFSNTLYATVNSNTGAEVWKSSTGDSGSWTQANTAGFGDTNNTGVWAASVFNSYLYVATGQWGPPVDTDTYTGTEVWRTNNGTTWTQVNTDGFGARGNMSPWLAPFNGYLYATSYTYNSNGSVTGAPMWRCAICDGTDWTTATSDGFGNSHNYWIYTAGLGSHFYAGTSNDVTGAQILETINGTSWTQINIDGFGNSNNGDIGSGVIFNGNYYFSTGNWANGAGIWSLLPSFGSINKWTSSFDLSHGWTVKDFARTMGDVNGDGNSDLVGFGQDGVYVALSNGSNGFGSISKWTSSFDLSHGWTVTDFVRTVGDVNHDGNADLIGFGQDGVYVALSDGASSFGPISKWTSSFDLSHGWTVADFVRTVGDVNNDGNADLIGFGQDGVYVALSNGSSSFGSISKWTSSFDLSHGWTVANFVRTVGDVNHDGNADLIGFGQDGVYVALSNGTGFGPISKWTSSFDLSHGWTVKDFVRTVGDVNLDGHADLIGFGQDGVYVALSNGSSSFGPISKWTSSFDLSHGWTVTDFVRTAGDVNHDGKADLAGFGLDGVYIALTR